MTDTTAETEAITKPTYDHDAAIKKAAAEIDLDKVIAALPADLQESIAALNQTWEEFTERGLLHVSSGEMAAYMTHADQVRMDAWEAADALQRKLSDYAGHDLRLIRREAWLTLGR